MMDALEARGRAIGEAGAARALDRVAEAVRAEAPGALVAVEDGRVVVTGRLLWRLPGLRWIGGLVR